MIPSFSENISVLKDRFPAPNKNASKPEGINNQFLSMVKTSLKSAQHPSGPRSQQLFHAAQPGEREYPPYLKSLRKALLAKGGTLENIALKSEDLNILTSFLLRCGFAEADLKKCLSGLVRNNPDGVINLADFFDSIKHLEPSQEKTDSNLILESSTVFQLERILRDIGFSLREVEDILSAAKLDDKNVDLDKLLAVLKKHETFQSDASISPEIHRIESILRDIGLSLHQVEDILNTARINGKNVDLDRLLTILEKQEAFQSNTRASSVLQIEGILKGIGISTHKEKDALSTARHDSKNFNLDRLLTVLKQNEAIQNNIVDHRHQVQDKQLISENQLFQGENEGRLSMKDFIDKLEQMAGKVDDGKQSTPEVRAAIDRILDKTVVAPTSVQEKMGQNNWYVDRAHLGSLIEDKGQPGKQKIGTIHPKTSTALPNQSDTAPGFERGFKLDMQDIKTEPTVIEISRDDAKPDISGSIYAMKQQSKPIRDALPAYLIDQVGRQISRSVLKGQRTIRLQLKPPELGVLKVDVDMKDNVLKLGMIAENGAVKEILQSGLPQLKESLVEQGVKIERLEIQVDQSFDQSLADSEEGSKKEPSNGQRSMQSLGRTRSSETDNDNLTEHSVGDPGIKARDDRILDLTA